MFRAPETSIEPGTYRARLKAVEETEGSNFNTGDPEMKWLFTFELLEEDYEGREISQMVNQNFGPRATARKFVEALVGRRINPGENLELDDIVGLEGILSVVVNDNGYNKIESVNPVRKKGRKTGQAENKKARKPVEVTEEEEADFDEIPF